LAEDEFVVEEDGETAGAASDDGVDDGQPDRLGIAGLRYRRLKKCVTYSY